MTKHLPYLLVPALAVQAFAQTYWVSARGDIATGIHQIHQVDSNGVWTGVSIDQVNAAQASTWGYRDGASDRQGHVYFGWEDGVARHDNDGSGGVQIITGGVPGGLGTWHGLAFDPTGDGGAGSLWAMNFANRTLVEVDLSGNLLNSYPNISDDVYGLAYDDSDGNLWAHLQGTFTGFAGDVIKINITTSPGTVISGVGWMSGFPLIAHGGGLTGLHDGSGLIAAINQAAPDELGVYDASGSMVGGPWDMSAQTGINGHLGVAVAVEAAGCAGDLDGDGDTDLADLGILLADFGCPQPGPCAGDLDGDGDTDLADLGILLADFGCDLP
jgi:hypothetical protein